MEILESPRLKLEDDDTFYSIIGFDDYVSTQITIPSFYKEKPIKQIADKAFYNHPLLKKIIFEEDSQITIIDDEAFSDCVGLISINLPKTVTRIGSKAFYKCENLESITIPKDLTVIEKETFYFCKKLKSITIPSNVTVINERAFNGCEKLKEIIFEKGSHLTEIGYKSFGLCSELKDIINILENLTTIKEYAFYGCSSLEQITIPKSVIKIENGAFHNCTKLKKVTFEEDSQLTEIGGAIFNSCYNLTDIKLPNSLKVIGARAFYSCKELKEIKFPKNITTIGSDAFYKCDGLTSVTIPKTVSTYHDVFSFCKNIKEIYFDGTINDWINTKFCFSEGYTHNPYWFCFPVYIKNENGEYESFKEITIPDGTKVITAQTLYFLEKLEKVTIPKSVTTIEYGNWFDCINLKEIYYDGTLEDLCKIKINDDKDCLFNETPRSLYYKNDNGEYEKVTKLIIPEGVTKIGRCIFSNIEDLTEVVLPSTLKIIDEFAFWKCNNLRKIQFPKNLKIIKKSAFEGCHNLRSVELPNTLTYVEGYIFSDCENLTFNTYDNANYLGNKDNPYTYLYSATNSEITSCNIHKDTKVIMPNAFIYCKEIEEIDIPEGVKIIGNRAFYYCENLEYITIPGSVTHLGYAFFANSKLIYILYSGTIKQWCKLKLKVDGQRWHILKTSNPIYYDFAGFYIKNSNDKYEPLTDLVIPDGVTKINKYAFYGFGQLKSITIPDSVKKIGTKAFYGCWAEEIKLGKNIKHIGDEAFKSSKINKLSLPKGLISIGKDAFSYSDIRTLSIPDSVKIIKENAFEGCSKLKSVKFKNIDNWKLYVNRSSRSKTIEEYKSDVSREELADPAKAANILLKNYNRLLKRKCKK